MKTKLLIKELEKHRITPVFDCGRITLAGDDSEAREHYSHMLLDNPKLEIDLILELAKIEEYIYCCIDERAAIRAAEELPGDFKSAVSCAII